MTAAPEDLTPAACVCACATVHPPAYANRCRQAPVAHRDLRATGVGLVAMPLCQSCNAQWAALGLGTLHSEDN